MNITKRRILMGFGAAATVLLGTTGVIVNAHAAESAQPPAGQLVPASVAGTDADPVGIRCAVDTVAPFFFSGEMGDMAAGQARIWCSDVVYALALEVHLVRDGVVIKHDEDDKDADAHQSDTPDLSNLSASVTTKCEPGVYETYATASAVFVEGDAAKTATFSSQPVTIGC